MGSCSVVPSARVREATPKDARLIHEYVRKLADFELLLDRVESTEESLRRDIFERKIVRALVVEAVDSDGESEPAGFALWYLTYSSFAGKPILYLEDLYVDPEYRRFGFARAIIERLKETARAEGCARIEWAVLDWNERALSFYASLGASAREGWTNYRLELD